MIDGGAHAQERVGRTLGGKYRLDALLGVGGMAAVYRGAHRNGNPVAIKVLHAALSVDADLRARFLKEGYVANAVGHPASVPEFARRDRVAVKSPRRSLWVGCRRFW